MQCKKARELLGDLSDGWPVEASLQEELRSHIAGCADCARYRAQLERFDAVFRAAPAVIQPPEAVWEKIREALSPGFVLQPQVPDVLGWLGNLLRQPAFAGMIVMAFFGFMLVAVVTRFTGQGGFAGKAATNEWINEDYATVYGFDTALERYLYR